MRSPAGARSGKTRPTSRPVSLLPLPEHRHRYPRPKLVLGQSIDLADGEQEGFEAIALAARHQSTASFICSKLVRRFVHDDPPYALVDECVAAFLASQDDADQLRQVTELILTSRELQLFPEYRRSKVKRPGVLLPSLLRAVGADPDPVATDYQGIRQTAAALGERIRNADPPTGYPDLSVVWASPGGLVQRFNLLEAAAASAAASWGVSGAQPAADVVETSPPVRFRRLVSAERATPRSRISVRSPRRTRRRSSKPARSCSRPRIS